MEEVRQQLKLQDLKLYLEVPDLEVEPGKAGFTFRDNTTPLKDIVVFVKHYDPFQMRLQYVIPFP